MKITFIPLFLTLALATLSLSSCEDPTTSSVSSQLCAAEQQAIDKAYERCKKAIDKRSDELWHWYNSRREGIPALVEELGSWDSKWNIMTGKDMQSYTRYHVERNIFSQKQCEEVTFEIIKKLQVEDYLGIEDDLAMDTHCATIGSEAKAKAVLMKKATSIQEASAILRTQFVTEAGIFVASEAAATLVTAVATSIATSTGIISAGAATSWASAGVTLVVGVIIAAIVDEVIDPSKKIEQSIHDMITRTKHQGVDEFERIALEALEIRKKQWEQDIINNK